MSVCVLLPLYVLEFAFDAKVAIASLHVVAIYDPSWIVTPRITTS